MQGGVRGTVLHLATQNGQVLLFIKNIRHGFGAIFDFGSGKMQEKVLYICIKETSILFCFT